MKIFPFLQKTAVPTLFRPFFLEMNFPKLLFGQIALSIIFSLVSCEKSPPSDNLQNETAGESISELFVITSPELEFLAEGKYGDKKVGQHFVIRQAQAQVVEFTDRPYRMAKIMQGGVVGFSNLYANSDFVGDPPNVTFAGHEVNTGKEQNTIIEIGQPFSFQGEPSKGLFVIIPVQNVLGPEKIPPFGLYKDCSMVVDVLQFLPDIISASSPFVDKFISMFEDYGSGNPSPATVTFTNNSGMKLQGYASQVWAGTQLRDDEEQPVSFSEIVLEADSVLVFAMQGQGGLYGAGSGGVFILASTDSIVLDGIGFTLLVMFSAGYFEYCCMPSQNVAMGVMPIQTAIWQDVLLEGDQSLLTNFLLTWWNQQDPPELKGNYSKGGWTPPAVSRSKIGDAIFVGHGNFAKIAKDADGDDLKNSDEALVTFLIEKQATVQ